MNAQQILTNTVSLVTPLSHKKRRLAMIACIDSLLYGATASVTGIGRGIRSLSKEKHQIKRADRLCSNTNLQAEVPGIYAGLTYLFTRASQRPLILVDWSDLDEYGRHFLLRASVAFSGQAITLYQEVHSIKTKEKPAVHRAFLASLKQMLGDECKPVIVTDAGFKTPWFRQVSALGWDFVGRARLPFLYQVGSAEWHSIKQLYPKATQTPKGFGALLNRSAPLACRLVLYKQPPKGRRSMNRAGKPYANQKAKKYAKGANEPWLLCTSLPLNRTLAKKAVNIYRQRMQIEESFRTMKNEHYGLGLARGRTYKQARLEILILLTTLANLVLILTGLAVQGKGLHYSYQANTERKRRVLSFHFLGLRAIASRRTHLDDEDWIEAIQSLSTLLRAVTYEAI